MERKDFSRVLYLGWCLSRSILSPLLFSVYIDTLVVQLEASGFGCRLHGLYAYHVALLGACCTTGDSNKFSFLRLVLPSWLR